MSAPPPPVDRPGWRSLTDTELYEHIFGVITIRQRETESLARSPAQVIERIDAVVEGMCTGPNCEARITSTSRSAWWCSEDCQGRYQAAYTVPPRRKRMTREGGRRTGSRWHP